MTKAMLPDEACRNVAASCNRILEVLEGLSTKDFLSAFKGDELHRASVLSNMQVVRMVFSDILEEAYPLPPIKGPSGS
jgi:hypothetical protein